MKNFRLWLLFIISAFSLMGCTTLQNIANNAPAAQTPSGVTVSAILARGGGWTTVGPFNPGEYKILPGGLPSGGFQLFFYAPYPATLALTIDGTPLPKFEDIPAGSDPKVSGYYRIININPNPSTPYWQISIRPPISQLTSSRYVVGIASVSINPNFRDAAGKNQVSAPLNITAIAQDVSTVAILFPGAGHGNVSIHAEGDLNSTPLDTYCDAECSIDFGALYNITLKAHPSGSSSFSGWSGACSGTNTSCQLNLRGKAMAVAATFSRGATSSTIDNCPPLAPPPGFSYFNKPLCDSQNVFNDPTPDLACNAQGYFCCAKKIGLTDTDCGSDHVKFPASCIGYSNPKIKLEPSGCYLQD